jgi:hypothetical protein
MRFQVPQFTDVEDKIFGPLTFKQFIYLAGGAGACIIIYYLIPFKILAFMIMVPTAVFSLALAFYKINNKPFINMVEAFFKYSITNKLYIWKHEPKKITDASNPKEISSNLLPKLSSSKLKDITWNLGVSENMNPVTKDNTNI